MPNFSQIIIPDSGADLLRQELTIAFGSLGFSIIRTHPENLHNSEHPHFLPKLLKKPSLLLSVNANGLAPIGDTLKILEAHKSSAAIWCVDNPWNVLSGVRDPLWKTIPFFVTDQSFVQQLKENGAKFASHLPLGACSACFAPSPERERIFPAPKNLAPFLFVGRSAFPNKNKFFAGINLPALEWQKAQEMIALGERPDITWWEKELSANSAEFWPSKKARLYAFCAEESSLLWRQTNLAFIAKLGAKLFGKEQGLHGHGLDIFGDAAWKIPDNAKLHPPIDYYARLPSLYAATRFNIALTSLQLPTGLNQRHFDTWIAGGFCLSDATSGLNIFPKDLVEPIIFHNAESLERKVKNIEGNPRFRNDLIIAWQEHLKAHHTYTHRATKLLQTLQDWEKMQTGTPANSLPS